MKTSVDDKRRIFLRMVFVFLLLYGIEYILDGNIKLGTSVLDDFDFLYKFNNESFITAILESGYKFRPVSNGIEWIVSNICKGNVYLYGYINLGLAAFTGTLVYILLFVEFKKEYFSIVGALLYVFSRFSYYQITTHLGVMEWLCTTVTIVLVALLYKYILTQESKYFYWGIFCFGVLALSHERYISLFPTMIFAWICSEKNKAIISAWVKPLLLCMVFAVIMILMNVFVTNIMMGTGGTPVETSTTFGTIQHFLKQGIGYLFGINSEEVYLSMISYSMYTWKAKWTVWISIAMLIGIVILSWYNIIGMSKEDRRKTIIIVATAILCVGALLFISAVTIRVELRWMYAPYMIMVMTFIYLLNLATSKKIYRIKIVMVAVYTIAMMGFGVYCRRYYTNLYYWDIYDKGNAFVESTYGRYGEDAFKKSWIVIADFEIASSWKDLLAQYDIDRKYNIKVKELATLEELSDVKRWDDKTVLYWQNGEFVDITTVIPYILN